MRNPIRPALLSAAVARKAMENIERRIVEPGLWTTHSPNPHSPRSTGETP